MGPSPSPEEALAEAAAHLQRLGVPFALDGGLAVSLRAEVRFTRDVDVAVSVEDDARLERVVRDLASSGYRAVAVVEHTERKRLATVRLASRLGIVVDLIAATCGIEAEIVERATPIDLDIGTVKVARAEELLAMKVLSMTDRRLQDRIDASSLLLVNADLDMEAVRSNLRCIRERGYAREQDLEAKLETLLRPTA
jgi:hypothetical protein